MRPFTPILAALLFLSGGATAQTNTASPPTPLSGVTVQAQPGPPATFHDRFVESLNFVTSHGQPAHLGQLARWTGPVCPVTLGLSPEMNALVSDRVKALDFKVGAPQARRPVRCKPNIEILFTDQPQALMDLVAKKRNVLLGFHYIPGERSMTRVTRPVQAYYLTETVAGGGGNGSVDVPASMGSAQSLDTEDSHMPGGCAGSAFTECLSSDFVNILIVADASALSDRKIGPIADYIALISMAQFKTLATCDALPTLLDMFTPACADRPAAETPGAQDVAYLKALYRGNGALKLWMQKNLAAEKMAAPAQP
jgi:hypothetical protein